MGSSKHRYTSCQSHPRCSFNVQWLSSADAWKSKGVCKAVLLCGPGQYNQRSPATNSGKTSPGKCSKCLAGKYKTSWDRTNVAAYMCQSCSSLAAYTCNKYVAVQQYRSGTCGGGTNTLRCNTCQVCNPGRYRDHCGSRHEGQCDGCPVSTWSDGKLGTPRPRALCPAPHDPRPACPPTRPAPCLLVILVAGALAQCDEKPVTV